MRLRATASRCGSIRRPSACASKNGQKLVDLVSDDYHSTVAVDAILTGVGRLPNVEGLNLEAAGVDYDAVDRRARRRFPADEQSAHLCRRRRACLEHKFTHTADASARIVVRNALFLGRAAAERADDSVVHLHRSGDRPRRPVRPRGARRATFRSRLSPSRCTTSIARSPTARKRGFVKIHVKERTDRILGATIVARHAGEMINEITLAMVAGIGLSTLARVIHAYPTQAEAIRRRPTPTSARGCRRRSGRCARAPDEGAAYEARAGRRMMQRPRIAATGRRRWNLG